MRYSESKKVKNFPRIPLEGSLDLTYRCNNNCRHCWLRLPDTSAERKRELGFEDIRRIVDEARSMGCRTWGISGGEPLLRPDFPEIFRYVTGRNAAYTLNTNGTLITPKIARLLKRKGCKMVALYGATAGVHDRVTRVSGSFEAAVRGMAYLREAGAGFIVQIVPMRDNVHQMRKMIRLARAQSPVYRIGAPWLYPRADGDRERNREIFRQRLDPREIVELEESEHGLEDAEEFPCGTAQTDRGLFAACIRDQREFHVDPYGRASFCAFIKDPAFRWDLKRDSLEKFWEEFLPSLAAKARSGKEYREGCGACRLRSDCSWCPAHAFLEHGRYAAKVDYLCAVAGENRKSREAWEERHVRYYGIGGITIRVESDLPMTEKTFLPKFRSFEVREPGSDFISIRHRFSPNFGPDFGNGSRGEEVYRKPPWIIYRKEDSWLYLVSSEKDGAEVIHQAAFFNSGHSRGTIYHDGPGRFRKGGLHSLTLFPSDQILLARVLAGLEGCYLHASGAILAGKGLLFAGHSGAGKSTMASMLMGNGEILCDDRVIARRWPEGFRVHGTWSHGDVAEVSAGHAPLTAILLLNKAPENRLEFVEDRAERIRSLLACLVRPLTTADWWEKSLALVERIAREVPCYRLYFDRSGKAVNLLKNQRW